MKRTKKRMNLKAAGLVAACLLLLQAPALPAYAVQPMSLADATNRALANNGEIKDLQMNISKKKIELSQAKQVEPDRSAKDFWWLFSQHSLNDDITVKMKVPTAMQALNQANRELDDKQRSVRFDIEKSYMSVYQAQQSASEAAKKLDQANKFASDVAAKQKFGLATKDDADTAKKAAEKSASDNKMAQLALKSATLDFGNKIGVDMETGDYSFSFKTQWVELNNNVMWQLVQSALQNDFGLYKDVEARKLAETKVSVTRSLYKGKFGTGEMAAIEAMYKPDQTITDYNAFLDKYDSMLADIKSQWEGFFFIPLPFFPVILPIPKPLLQGEYDGLRYFSDVRYSLPVSMLDLDKAKLKESKTRTDLIAKVKKSYLDAKQAEEAYIQTMKDRDKVKADTDAMRTKNKFGLVTAEELQAQQDKQGKAEDGVMGGYLAYKTMLSKLNLDTTGAVDRLYRDGVPPYKVDDGMGPITKNPAGDNQENAAIGTFSIEDVAETMTSKFSLKITDAKLGADHYRLMTTDGKPIGDLLPLDGKITHLNLVLSDTSNLKVVLYKGQDEVATASLDGYGASGTLVKAK